MMNIKLLRTVLLAVLTLGLCTIVAAQDDPATDADVIVTDVDTIVVPDPDPVVVQDMTSDYAIEEITDNSDAYYGSVVTIEGSLTNFVGSRIFEVGEEEALTNSFVLVVNNSSQALPASLVEGVNLRITGRVYPSFDVVQNGADVVYEPFNAGDATATTEGEMQRLNMVDFVQRGYIPGNFGQHTILEILNVENIEVLGYDDLIING